MDDGGGHLLSAGLNEFLAAARALGIKSTAVSSGQRGDARRVRAFALAGIAPFTDQGRVARGGNLGATSGPGRIGGVDHGIKKHAVVFVLFVVDLVLSQMARSQSFGARSTYRRLELRRRVALRPRRDLEQVVNRNAASCPRFVLVVAGRALALA